MIRRLAILLLIGAGLGAVLQREEDRGTFDSWHRRILDRLEGRSVPSRVVLIEMRRGDLPFETWPPSPIDHALILESLVRHQPRAVAVQSLLAWPSVEPLNAATLAERIALLPRGVLACTLQQSPEVGTPFDAPPDALPLARLIHIAGDVSRIPSFATLGQTPPDDVRGTKSLGFTRIELGENPHVEEHGIAVPLLARRNTDVVPSLLLQCLIAWQGRTTEEVTVDLGRKITVSPELTLPIDDSGRLWIHTRLSPPVRRADAGALLLDLDQDAKWLQAQAADVATLQAIDRSLVVVGETGETTPRYELGNGQSWTEAEMIAQGLNAVLTGENIREVRRPLQWISWALVATAAGLLLPCPRRWFAFFFLGGGAILALGLALVFLGGGWWLPPIPPLALWLATGIVAALLPGPRAAVTTPPTPSPVPEGVQTTDPTDPTDAANAANAEDEQLARQCLDETPPVTANDRSGESEASVNIDDGETNTLEPEAIAIDAPRAAEARPEKHGSHRRGKHRRR